MAPRLQLQTLLETLIGSRNVYFQPPATVKMNYPAIVYKRDRLDMRHANNNVYRFTKRYTLTYIDKNPDSPIPDEIAMLPLCSFSRHFTADNLNHDIFNIYY